MNEVTYKISTYPSRFLGYQSKKQDKGIVKLYISTMYNHSSNFNSFLEIFIRIMILERICLERGFHKIRMKNRCNTFNWTMGKTFRATGKIADIFMKIDFLQFPCKMDFVASIIFEMMEW